MATSDEAKQAIIDAINYRASNPSVLSGDAIKHLAEAWVIMKDEGSSQVF